MTLDLSLHDGLLLLLIGILLAIISLCSSISSLCTSTQQLLPAVDLLSSSDLAFFIVVENIDDILLHIHLSLSDLVLAGWRSF